MKMFLLILFKFTLECVCAFSEAFHKADGSVRSNRHYNKYNMSCPFSTLIASMLTTQYNHSVTSVFMLMWSFYNHASRLFGTAVPELFLREYRLNISDDLGALRNDFCASIKQ
jgi:hypothetical protein